MQTTRANGVCNWKASSGGGGGRANERVKRARELQRWRRRERRKREQHTLLFICCVIKKWSASPTSCVARRSARYQFFAHGHISQATNRTDAHSTERPNDRSSALRAGWLPAGADQAKARVPRERAALLLRRERSNWRRGRPGPRHTTTTLCEQHIMHHRRTMG